ncbi:unnamed protein product, partial [Prorocentrum cordatum]
DADAKFWNWSTAKLIVSRSARPHINILECETSLMALRWRARAVVRLGRVFLHLLDITVSTGSQQLNKVARAYRVLDLAKAPSRAQPMPLRVKSVLAGSALEKGMDDFAACVRARLHLCMQTGSLLGLVLAA